MLAPHVPGREPPWAQRPTEPPRVATRTLAAASSIPASRRHVLPPLEPPTLRPDTLHPQQTATSNRTNLAVLLDHFLALEGNHDMFAQDGVQRGCRPMSFVPAVKIIRPRIRPGIAWAYRSEVPKCTAFCTPGTPLLAGTLPLGNRRCPFSTRRSHRDRHRDFQFSLASEGSRQVLTRNLGQPSDKLGRIEREDAGFVIV